MTFVEAINFSNMPILALWICVFLALNILGMCTKKSLFNLIPLILSVLFLVIHVWNKFLILETIFQNLMVDFISMIVSISLYIYVDEIEARRKVISEVFENKYKNRRKK